MGVVSFFDERIFSDEALHKPALMGELLRNRSLVLLGFWRAFRSDEICRMNIEHIHVEENQGMSIHLPRSKGDREGLNPGSSRQMTNEASRINGIGNEQAQSFPTFTSQ